MAKKEKLPLTPEQLAAKNERKAEKRKIFGSSFLKYLAVTLSIILVFAVVRMAFGQGLQVIQHVKNEGVAAAAADNSGSNNGGSNNGGSNNGGSSDNNSGTPVDNNSSGNNGGSSDNSSSTPADNNSGDSGSSSAAVTDPAEVAKLINNATANAVNSKAGYDWQRHGEVNNIDVGSATNILNRIIQGVDSNADLNSVVGGFLGRGDKKETVPKGQTLDTIDVKKDDGTTEKLYHGASYTLKATQLQAGDIQNLKVKGNSYEFDLPNSKNPNRSGNTALSRFTNDIVIQSEVDSEIKGFVSVVSVNSLETDYKNIHAKVTIVDGKLTELIYAYSASAKLGIKAGVSITGTGNLVATAKYSNFVY